MFPIEDYYKLPRLVEQTTIFLWRHGYRYFSLIGVNWDDAKKQWLVSYRSYFDDKPVSLWVDITCFDSDGNFQVQAVQPVAPLISVS